jgi:cysteine sulfinate desulfinase/cysteine desulfurase-like protein
MGIPAEVGAGAIRFSLGRSTTADQIGRVVDILKEDLLSG